MITSAVTNVISSYANGLTTWSRSGLLLKYVAFFLLYPYLSHLTTPLIENGVVDLDSSPDFARKHHALEVTSDSFSYLLPRPCQHYTFKCTCIIFFRMYFGLRTFVSDNVLSSFRHIQSQFTLQTSIYEYFLDGTTHALHFPSLLCIIVFVAFIHSRVSVRMPHSRTSLIHPFIHVSFVRVTISSRWRARIKQAQ